MKRELALDHAAGRLDDKTYLAQIAVLREEATRIDSGERPATRIAPDKVVAKAAGGFPRHEPRRRLRAGRSCCTRSTSGSSSAARSSSALD